MQSYRQGVHIIDDQIRNQMKICSFDLKCEGLVLDFVPETNATKTGQLYKVGDLYTFFEVPTVDGYLLKVMLPAKAYQKRLSELKSTLAGEFLFYALLIALISFLFSLYALRPLKRALELNEEFVRDILHDINTPLSTLVVNFKLFKKEIGENRKIERMHKSVETILSLQNNLQAFLDSSLLQKESFDLKQIVEERVAFFQSLYPKILFEVALDALSLHTNREAFTRIIDNLLSNAAKYNRTDGRVSVVLKDRKLLIQDTGIGIRDTKKVFERFYKETDRGMGIGMHIVKKLCDILTIPVSIESEVGRGTTVMLDLTAVIVE